jgi:hypothetical protein
MNPPGFAGLPGFKPAPTQKKKTPLGGEKCVGTGEKHTRKTWKPATRVYRPALTFTS